MVNKCSLDQSTSFQSHLESILWWFFVICQNQKFCSPIGDNTKNHATKIQKRHTSTICKNTEHQRNQFRIQNFNLEFSSCIKLFIVFLKHLLSVPFVLGTSAINKLFHFADAKFGNPWNKDQENIDKAWNSNNHTHIWEPSLAEIRIIPIKQGEPWGYNILQWFDRGVNHCN